MKTEKEKWYCIKRLEAKKHHIKPIAYDGMQEAFKSMRAVGGIKRMDMYEDWTVADGESIISRDLNCVEEYR